MNLRGKLFLEQLYKFLKNRKVSLVKKTVLKEIIAKNLLEFSNEIQERRVSIKIDSYRNFAILIIFRMTRAKDRQYIESSKF